MQYFPFGKINTYHGGTAIYLTKKTDIIILIRTPKLLFLDNSFIHISNDASKSTEKSN